MNKGLYATLAILLAVLILLISLPDRITTPKTEDHLIQIEEKIVRGNSLSPLIKPGQTVKVSLNYYSYYPIERGDIVLYNYAGNKDPLIKIIKGIPGDRLELENIGGGWNILINGEVVKNSENRPFLVSGNAYKMLSLYEGVIPESAYLLLGEIVSGTLDSTRFGLVHKSDILGKVLHLTSLFFSVIYLS